MIPQSSAEDVSHCVIQYHLPKTAGSTLRYALVLLFRKEEMFKMTWKEWQERLDRLRAMPAHERSRLRLIFGHQPFGLHRDLEQPCQYFIMLRDPVERCLSHYFHDFRDDTLEKFLDQARHSRKSMESGGSAEVFHNYRNVMTRFLANEPFGEAYREPQVMLDTAIERLNTAAVGLVSHFEESRLRLEKLIGKPVQPLISEKCNPSRPRAGDLPDDVLDFLRNINKLDAVLYEEGRRLFSHQIRESDRQSESDGEPPR